MTDEAKTLIEETKKLIEDYKHCAKCGKVVPETLPEGYACCGDMTIVKKKIGIVPYGLLEFGEEIEITTDPGNVHKYVTDVLDNMRQFSSVGEPHRVTRDAHAVEVYDTDGKVVGGFDFTNELSGIPGKDGFFPLDNPDLVLRLKLADAITKYINALLPPINLCIKEHRIFPKTPPDLPEDGELQSTVPTSAPPLGPNGGPIIRLRRRLGHRSGHHPKFVKLCEDIVAAYDQ